MRLLFITPTLLDAPRGGRAMLGRLHRDVLRDILGAGFAEHRLADTRANAWRSLLGYIDGATPAGLAAALNAVDSHAADTVWLDGSNLGRIARAIRRARPGVRVVTFCHNVEARFFLGSLRRTVRPHAAAVLIANYVAERIALRDSDTVIALSDRDRALFRRFYGRPADHVLPIALEDRLRDRRGENPSAGATGSLLFVGGAFYANLAGIRWFAREVAPRIETDVAIVGLGMEQLARELADAKNVSLVGAVDALEPWYVDASLVIAPIFDGSGMKTKVAEALMFGKHVAGTPEAFSGYAADVVASNAVCADADGLVAALSRAKAAPPPAYDPAMRQFYERDHSPAAARARLAGILGVADPTSSS
jgi:glycosyltransferase involved in cell wall biosynthesis